MGDGAHSDVKTTAHRECKLGQACHDYRRVALISHRAMPNQKVWLWHDTTQRPTLALTYVLWAQNRMEQFLRSAASFGHTPGPLGASAQA